MWTRITAGWQGVLRCLTQRLDRMPCGCVSAGSTGRGEFPPAARRQGRRPRANAIRVLCTLARQPGTLLSKNALLDEVWGTNSSATGAEDRHQRPQNLLDDDARQPLIETVSRRGIASSPPRLRSPLREPLKRARRAFPHLNSHRSSHAGKRFHGCTAPGTPHATARAPCSGLPGSPVSARPR